MRILSEKQDALVGNMLSEMVLHTSSHANSTREHTRNCPQHCHQAHSKPQQSSSTQQQHTQQQQHRCWLTHTAAAHQQQQCYWACFSETLRVSLSCLLVLLYVLAYTHRSSSATAVLLGLLLRNTPCVTFVPARSAVRSSRSCSPLSLARCRGA